MLIYFRALGFFFCHLVTYFDLHPAIPLMAVVFQEIEWLFLKSCVKFSILLFDTLDPNFKS